MALREKIGKWFWRTEWARYVAAILYMLLMTAACGLLLGLMLAVCLVVARGCA
jgi:ABC-type methionine transport system permease subunit